MLGFFFFSFFFFLRVVLPAALPSAVTALVLVAASGGVRGRPYVVSTAWETHYVWLRPHLAIPKSTAAATGRLRGAERLLRGWALGFLFFLLVLPSAVSALVLVAAAGGVRGRPYVVSAAWETHYVWLRPHLAIPKSTAAATGRLRGAERLLRGWALGFFFFLLVLPAVLLSARSALVLMAASGGVRGRPCVVSTAWETHYVWLRPHLAIPKSTAAATGRLRGAERLLRGWAAASSVNF